MKPIRKYQCEMCRTEYSNEQAALDCEKSHKLPLSIMGVRHLPKGQGRDGYPPAITIRMSDGKDITYKR